MSLMHPLGRPESAQLAYNVSHRTVKAAGDLEHFHNLAGRLYVSESGWGFLSVPNALVHGAFDALDEPGVELPKGDNGRVTAHISVFRPEDIEQIGGKDKITERGHSFKYSLGRTAAVNPSGWDGMSKVWMIEVRSPELKQLRKSYGLSPLPKDNKFQFHITFAIRRTGVLQGSEIRKAADDAV